MTSAILSFATSKIGGMIGWTIAVAGIVGLGWFYLQYQYQKIDIMVLEHENEQMRSEIATLQTMYKTATAEATSNKQQLEGCLETFDKRQEDIERIDRVKQKVKHVPATEKPEVVDDETGKDFLDSYNAIHHD